MDGIEMSEGRETWLEEARAAVGYLQDIRHRRVQVSDEPAPEIKGLELNIADMSLFHMEEITFEEKAPRREAMGNILGTLRHMQGINFVYMILGDPDGVNFYLGVVRDVSQGNPPTFGLGDIGKCILQPAIRGNFRGCQLHQISDNAEKKAILNRLKGGCGDAEGRAGSRFYPGMLEGIPTIDEKNENFQGVERLVDVMLGDGDTFGLIVIAQPYDDDRIHDTEEKLQAVYNRLSPLARCSRQVSVSTSQNKNRNDTHGTGKSANQGHSRNTSAGSNTSVHKSSDTRKDTGNSIQASSVHGTSQGKQHNESASKNEHISNGDQSGSDAITDSCSHNEQGTHMYTSSFNEAGTISKSDGKSSSWNDSVNKSCQVSFSRNHSTSTVQGRSDHMSRTTQMEMETKSAVDWLKYLDEILMPRLDRGRGKGLFLSCCYLFGNTPTTLYRLAQTVISLYSGPKGNRAPLFFTELQRDSPCQQYLRNLQLPRVRLQEQEPESLAAAFSRDVQSGVSTCGNWLSADELSVLAGMPQKEIIGLRLREEVEFGLNVRYASQQSVEDRLELGSLVQCGAVRENIPVFLSRHNLDKHTFITGVTGSGKTTTCQNILLESHMPFLVIEPAKTEYRILKEQCKDLLFFTPGNHKVAPFFLNPFELFPDESVTARADMLKATCQATFHMEAAIPQLLEAAIYRVYQDKGWNIGTNTWKGRKLDAPDGPLADGVYAFPTLGEFYTVLEKVVKEQGFDDRLHDEYLGTMRSLLQGMLVGAKGMMFNTPRSIDFNDLVGRKVVIELEAIRNGAEKSLLMGFILTNLLQAVKARHFAASQRGEKFQHITLVEEAHRLLSRYMPGDSLNKKQGVEVFADMLAEVRKYGESMIIVDQIPDKMTPEVLKNTNTKIVHKIFAQDDKEAIGNTMALNREQKNFLSNLVAGRAIVFTQDWTKAVQVQVHQKQKTEDYQEIQPQEIREIAIEYYRSVYKRGILMGLERKENVTARMVGQYLQLLVDDQLCAGCKKLDSLAGQPAQLAAWVAVIQQALQWAGRELTGFFLYSRMSPDVEDAVKFQAVRRLLADIQEGKKIDSMYIHTNLSSLI